MGASGSRSSCASSNWLSRPDPTDLTAQDAAGESHRARARKSERSSPLLVRVIEAADTLERTISSATGEWWGLLIWSPGIQRASSFLQRLRRDYAKSRYVRVHADRRAQPGNAQDELVNNAARVMSGSTVRAESTRSVSYLVCSGLEAGDFPLLKLSGAVPDSLPKSSPLPRRGSSIGRSRSRSRG
jgi:hypothetical protein